MTFAEVVKLVQETIPKGGRHQGVKAYILPRRIAFETLCTIEPWAKFVLAEEVAHQLWVVFIDEAPEQAWEHRCRLILVGDEIAEVLMDLSIHFQPNMFREMEPLSL
ncbi:hypothetical protein [Candidatus Entotheonella palauensis]|uniref:Uncharacterized protein n=1 Tax=Candidatus Entotheonella gemina TaxID=1429439 RepID=W4MAX0_9BACT|nr:hypothetical protein [Candidatus Entotheonella palauensis]ETX07529.1 MAG: hypothetical protein ETSY2_10665 [Candidatus Entotheonella gemina]